VSTLHRRQDPPAFSDRHEAGVGLAGQLPQYAGKADVVILALPRGGVPVAAEVARARELLETWGRHEID
jgi:predicted phosphoribosyltransferase